MTPARRVVFYAIPSSRIGSRDRGLATRRLVSDRSNYAGKLNNQFALEKINAGRARRASPWPFLRMSASGKQDCEVKFNINNILRVIRDITKTSSSFLVTITGNVEIRRVATRCKVVNPFTSRLEALRDVPSLLYGGQT